MKAFEGGTTVFLLTPEKHNSENIIEETKIIIENYKAAVEATGIKRVICLLCVGAHIAENTGNILLSRMLEQAFINTNVEKVFVRPSYFYSNWLVYLDLINEVGVLPTFYPADFGVEMHSPMDVAKFVAQCVLKDKTGKETQIYELIGPKKYSSKDIADIFSKKLNKSVQLQVVSKNDRISTLTSAGFTENAAQNMSDMTQAVINGLTQPEFGDKVIRLSTTFDEYLDDMQM